MHTGKAKQQKLFKEEEELPPIIKIPLVKKIINTFAPEMVRQPKNHRKTLLAISAYLCDDAKLASKALRQCLPIEFYDTLYQLKKELRGTDLRKYSFAMEIHKEQFRSLLAQEVLEEE